MCRTCFRDLGYWTKRQWSPKGIQKFVPDVVRRAECSRTPAQGALLGSMAANPSDLG
jgi:hypothetical protein